MAHERDAKIIRQEERIHKLIKEVERLKGICSERFNFIQEKIDTIEGQRGRLIDLQSQLDTANKEIERLKNERDTSDTK